MKGETTMNRKITRLFSLFLTLAMALSLTACGGKKEEAPAEAPADAAAEAPEGPSVSGDLMIYTSAEDAFISEVCAKFNAKYPEANAEYYRSGTEEVVSKIMAEKMTNSIQADLIMVSDAATFENLKANDLLQPYDSPELGNIYTEFVDPEHYYYGTFPAAMGIVYNTDLVKEAPTSWFDLLKDEAKANTVMPNPLYSGTAANMLLELTRADGIGWEYYEGLLNNEVMIVNGNGGVINSVASGENAYGIACDSNALAGAASGSPLAFVYPEEGVPATADPIGITSTTDNLTAAQAFVDFMLSEEIQTLGRELIGKAPIRKGMEVPEGSLTVEERVNLISDAKVLFEICEGEKEKFAQMFGF